MEEPVANIEPVTKQEILDNRALLALLLALAKADETSS